MMISGLGMTRGVKVQRVVYSEIQGKRACTLEVVCEASVGQRTYYVFETDGMVKKSHLQGLVLSQTV